MSGRCRIHDLELRPMCGPCLTGPLRDQIRKLTSRVVELADRVDRLEAGDEDETEERDS